MKEKKKRGPAGGEVEEEEGQEGEKEKENGKEGKGRK